MAGVPGFDRSFSFNDSKPTTQPQKKKQKDFWTDQISTGGGIAGAASGAALGAGIGSIVPGIGTAIGGLAGGILGGAFGSGAGELGENFITNEDDKFKNVGQEALLGGIFSAPPLRLAKGALAAGKAGLGAGEQTAKTAFEEALTGAGKTAGTNGFLNNVANKTYAQAFNLPRKFTGQLKPEETASQLIRYGIGGGLDNIERSSQKALSTLGSILDNSVVGIGGDVKIGDVSNVFKGLEKHSIPKGELTALRNSVTDIGTTGRNLGYENPTAVLEKIRELESKGFNFVKAGQSNITPNPNSEALGNAYLQASRTLEDNLYGGITSTGALKALQTDANKSALNSIAKGLGDEFVKIKDPKELRTLMQPFVRARQLTSLTRDEAQAAGTQGAGNIANKGVGGVTGTVVGSMAGGPIGALAGGAAGFLGAPILRGAQEAVQAPISTAVGRGIGKLAGGGAPPPAGGLGGLLSPASRTVGGEAGRYVRPSALYSAVGQNTFGNNQSKPSLEDSLMQQSGQYQPDQGSQQETGLPDGYTSSFGLEDPSQQTQQDVSPYSRENLMADIQRDPANASKYLDYYAQLQEVFAPPKGSELSATAKGSLASSENALNTVSQLEQMFSQAGGGNGRIGGAVQEFNANAGLDQNAKVYNDSSNASVTQIAKALAGTGSGTVSDMDAKVILNLIPKITDTREEAQAKFNALKQRLLLAQQSAYNYGQGGSSLEDALLQSQGSYQ